MHGSTQLRLKTNDIRRFDSIVVRGLHERGVFVDAQRSSRGGGASPRSLDVLFVSRQEVTLVGVFFFERLYGGHVFVSLEFALLGFEVKVFL